MWLGQSGADLPARGEEPLGPFPAPATNMWGPSPSFVETEEQWRRRRGRVTGKTVGIGEGAAAGAEVSPG